MVDSNTDLTILERRLSALLEELRDSESEKSWFEVENVSQALANGLRSRDEPVDSHTILGKTVLPETLTSLFTLALHGFSTPDDDRTSVVFELLRVAANICLDHDDNRGRLLEAGFPQAIISLLEGYAESIPPPPRTQPLDLSLAHIKVIRTSIGALLNASIGYEPVKFRLISLEAPLTILKLSTAIYPTGYWYNGSAESDSLETASEDAWAVRSGLADWAWRAISELKDVKDETLQIFTPDFLPLLVSPLLAFLPKSPPTPRPLFDVHSTFTSNLINADYEDLEESCMLIESLSLDVEDIRLSLARGLHFPAEHGGMPCLSVILDFIEHGSYPPSWNSPVFDEAERKRKEKAFNICKAALIKSVVEVAGEESNEDVLWDDSESDKPGGDFVYRMVDWLKRYVNDMNATSSNRAPNSQSIFDREDMVICASLALGNLARREKNSTALVSPPYSLAPVLASPHLLSPSTDIKVKHGVIGLLKHLAQAPPHSRAIHSALGKAGVVRRIAGSGVWDEKAGAMADIVQLSAIGVVKHMCNANVEHTFALVLPSSSSPSSTTGLAQVLALVKRSDSVPIKSEGSRVLVNVVRSLWSSSLPASPATDSQASPIAAGTVDKEDVLERQRKRNAAMRAVLTPACISTLASLVGRSGKYPLLVNEGVVALSLLSTHKEGAKLVLDALMVPLGLDSPTSPTDATSPPTTASDVGIPSSSTPSAGPRLNTPRHPLDMLIFTLKNVDNPVNFPVEVRANVCSFFVQLSKHTSGEELDKVKATARPVLESLLAAPVKEDMLEKAMQRVLDGWS
ncbi:putative small GTPase mediated signal transduction [Lyophyllum shimeji]|uniref:Small GTPase mediated signal transduction n=1 Tax=Lyophyllum shimeji TaxID=47721 RepID=A0A9P3PGJ9_LYOSH|nr:putative small GTPase mediated signal transduction [Lyophyllum shimeji]